MRASIRGLVLIVCVGLWSVPSALAAMGVPDGVYIGRGTLWKLGGLIQVPFTATRVLVNDTLTASSVASVAGLPVAINARLAFAPSTRGDHPFDVLSLDELDANGSPTVVGASGCGQGYCGFQATIKHGHFRLRETWVVQPDGSFVVSQGWQSAYGVEMSYQAVFYRQ
jgi:hypothetical protein